MDKYDFAAIEAKWQARWDAARPVRVEEDASKPKFYNLCMYPYPSGELHMGHLRNYTYGDLLTRYKTMQGFNVLSPMGWDSFGLPAENAAIDTGVHPLAFTEERIARMTEQMKRTGALYDWDREVAAHRPEYYRWTQWLFLELWKRGLAYKANSPVNWCPKDNTVLANEQVIDGLCDRCDTPVEKRDLDQWFFKITEYADRLVDDLEQLEKWPERVRVMQENWIGRSQGAQFSMSVPGTGQTFEVFTTRPDTSFGMTFVVLAPEHPLVDELVAGTEKETEVAAFKEEISRLSEIERMSTEGDKRGLALGVNAINPFNGEEIPIFIADYVLVTYGTGAIMAVPGQDQRDWDFATEHGLPIVRTVQPPDGWEGEAYTGEGPAINSDWLDGLGVEDAVARATDWLEAEGIGTSKVQYRLRDWLISRQRYWGCPIPMVSCPECGLVPVPEAELPVTLPELDDFTPKGKAPLATVDSFVNTSCPECGSPAQRETDTMDTFVDSSWYFLRYADPDNEEAPFTKDKADYWMSVDQYIGGIEHAVLHLMYARFFVKVLYDLRMVSVEEPFAALFTQGMITLGGAKMSKSKGNVIAPDEYFRTHGADALRLYHLFIGPPTDQAIWNDSGVDGTFRFLDRVWRLGDHVAAAEAGEPGDADREILSDAHRTLKKVTEDIDRFAFNTAVAALMKFNNSLLQHAQADPEGDTLREAYRMLLLMLAPMAPHVAAELWERHGFGRELIDQELIDQPWPAWDPALVVETMTTLVVQINGKVRDRLEVAADISEEEATAAALGSDKIVARLAGAEPRKVISLPPRLVNIVV